MGRIYALANQKGGVGKTTTAVNLGAYLADAGKRVLLVDVDPQGNATSSLGVDKSALSRSMYDVLIGAEPAANVVMLTARLGLDLLPSTPHLAGAEVEMVELTGREMRLRRALDAVRARYDYVLIDTPPSLGMLTVNALTASDGVKLHGWFVPSAARWRAVLFFHGNAGNISHRLQTIAILHRLGLAALMIDYRGYGRSGGRPSEEGLYRDAEAAYDWLRARPEIDPSSIVAFGRSLGGAVAVELARRRTVSALIVESAFS